MRGRKPKPTILKLVTGNPGKRPLNEHEVKPRIERPDPPDFLNEEAKSEWRRRIDRLYALGLMTELDVPVFAAFCQSYGRMVQAERALARQAAREEELARASGRDSTSALMIRTAKGNPIQNPLVGTANHAMSEMVRYAAEFGMSPSARARIDVGFGPRDEEEATKQTGTAEDFY